jgi:hypothetical protein
MKEQERINEKIKKFPYGKRGDGSTLMRSYRMAPDVLEELDVYPSKTGMLSVLVRESRDRRLAEK